MPTATDIAQIHALYTQLTGLTIRLNTAFEKDWWEWLKAGYTPDDLRVVINYLRKGIHDGTRQPACLLPRNLIRQVDKFEEDLAMARANGRIRPVDPARASVLYATGRPSAPPPPPARKVADIIAGDAAFKQFQSLKKDL